MTLATPTTPSAPPPAPGLRSIIIEDKVHIPSWVVDLDSYRRWAKSDDYPSHGWFSFLDGELWADLSKEQLFTHNLVKTEFTGVVAPLVKAQRLGYFCSDRMLLSHVEANLSTEPDALFAAWDTVRNARLRLVPGADQGFIELEGTPDMVLEIVSPTSVRKDTVRLRELYARAAVAEYWLVNALGAPQFEILRLGPGGYEAVEPQDGWLTSAVFGRAFRLGRETDPLGHPAYTLAVRSPS
jgi:Uma2 family endonuclease